MFNLMGATPRRAPFSDWKARIERIIERRVDAHVPPLYDSALLRSCYHVGLSPDEVADELLEGYDDGC